MKRGQFGLSSFYNIGSTWKEIVEGNLDLRSGQTANWQRMGNAVEWTDERE
jgi:hypothetical protein